MSWALLHDVDNYMRTGRAVVSEAPARKLGSSLDFLSDGVQAIPCEFLGVQSRELVIDLDEILGPLFIALHDLRVQDDDYESVTITWARNNVSQGNITIPAHDVFISGGSVGFTQGNTAADQVRILVNPNTGNADWSLAEIAIGRDYFDPFGDGSSGISAPRRTEYGRGWNTVENGPWRSKLAEPAKSFAMSLAAGRDRHLLEHLLWLSEGGARPVSFIPDTSKREAIHGHLSDDFAASQGLGGIWDEGAAFSVTESMRVLR